MTIGQKFKMKKNREAAKISALSSGKIDKYEFLKTKKIWPSNQSRIKRQTTFTYSPLGKVLKNKLKTVEDQRTKQVENLKTLNPEKIKN